MNSNKKTSAIILSAGASSRMGSPKALIRIGEGTLLEDQYLRLSEAGIEDIFIVVGSDPEKIIAAHNTLKCKWVINTNWQKETFSSVLAGLKETGGHVLLLPVDTVGVDPATIDHIVNSGLKYSCNIIPTYKGRGGHPVFLSRAFVDELIQRAPVNARLDLLLKSWPAVKRIEVDSKNILTNINEPADLKDQMKEISPVSQ